MSVENFFPADRSFVFLPCANRASSAPEDQGPQPESLARATGAQLPGLIHRQGWTGDYFVSLDGRSIAR